MPLNFWYRADRPNIDWTDDNGSLMDNIPWKPSIHMPREASRITLEITGVLVERLQDISEEDARAEGITDGGCINCGESEPCGCKNPEPLPSESFMQEWDEIYGKESWDDNPFVWVISFKRI